MSTTPIGDYGLISDCHSCALVDKAGSVDWLSLTRFDRPSVLGRLLDDNAGHFSITPEGRYTSTRRYVGRSMVLETTFSANGSTGVLTDAMALDPDQPGHDLGAGAPGVLVRRIECTEGEMSYRVEYAPRPEYGLITPLLSPVEGGLVARGGAEVLLLSTPVELETAHATGRAIVPLRAGESLTFALQHGFSWTEAPKAWTQAEADAALSGTIAVWDMWSSLHQHYHGPWSDAVYRSGSVLQALMYQPTGAIVAAATTSLPETVGGERNWDYRYAWVRDASFTLDALWVAACPDEAEKFFSWMTHTVASQITGGADLQIMFGVGGEHDLSERTLDHLSGWRDSRPVRVGNGAWSQRQLDVYGELLDAAYRLKDQLEVLDDATCDFLIQVADAAAERWQEKDQGIWEIRDEPRDFVYSKLMCWVAMDRGIKLAGMLGAEDRVAEWTKTRDEIRNSILEHAWNEEANAFTQSLDSEHLDASNLMMCIVGFIDAKDPKMLATINATDERLTDERGLVYRYLADDGLGGEEGTFLLCTFWLAHALALAGEVDRAKEVFERAASYANDLGLLAEEVDEASGELLGNFPQAFSHIGLVNAAWAISQAEKGLPSLIT